MIFDHCDYGYSRDSDEPEVIDDSPSPEELAQHAEELELVCSTAGRILDKVDQFALRFYYFNERTYAYTAKKLGVSRECVQQMVEGAVWRIRVELKQEAPPKRPMVRRYHVEYLDIRGAIGPRYGSLGEAEAHAEAYRRAGGVCRVWATSGIAR